MKNNITTNMDTMDEIIQRLLILENLVSNSSVSEDIIDLIVLTTILTYDDIYTYVTSKETLKARKTQSNLLTPEERSMLIEILRIIKYAFMVFGDLNKATNWLRKPKRQLKGKCPMNLLGKNDGIDVIRQWLIKIEHGIAV